MVWKFVYLRPLLASLSMTGVRAGPPNALLAPNPTSSIKIQMTFGAPLELGGVGAVPGIDSA